MNKSTKYSGMIFLLIGVVIGGLVFSHFNEASEPKVFSSPAPAPTSSVTPSRDRPITTLRDLNNAFVDIAETVKPTVVTVFTEKVMRFSQRQGPFSFFGDPFRDFFGDEFYSNPRERRRQTPEREFRQQGLGSGVIVRENGYILTNNHVIDDADSIYVRTIDNHMYPAKVIGADPKTDLAVIKVDAKNLSAIKIGNSDQLRAGEWVLAVGSPLSQDLAHTVTQGIVSATGRSSVGIADYEDFIQTDAAINPGNSGGALVNLDGELVGINTAIASRSGGFQGIGFAVPTKMAENIMESLIKYGKVVRGYLGVNIQNLNEAMAQAMDLNNTEGALVAEVVPKGPADKAGIKDGDVIIEMNGKKVKDTRQLRNDIAATPPATTVEFKILREGKSRELAVILGELPGEGRAPSAESGNDAPELEESLRFSVANLSNALANRYDIDPEQTGVVVVSIDEGSRAFRAGLREGDLIRSVNRKRAQNVTEFNRLAADARPGDTIMLQIVRQSGSLFLAFEL